MATFPRGAGIGCGWSQEEKSSNSRTALVAVAAAAGVLLLVVVILAVRRRRQRASSVNLQRPDKESAFSNPVRHGLSGALLPPWDASPLGLCLSHRPACCWWGWYRGQTYGDNSYDFPADVHGSDAWVACASCVAAAHGNPISAGGASALQALR